MRIPPWKTRKVDSPDKRKIELSGRGMEHARAASLVCFVIQRRVTHSPALPLSVCTFVRSKTYSTVVAYTLVSPRRARVSTHTRLSLWLCIFSSPLPPPPSSLRFSRAFMQIFCTFVFLFLVCLYEKKKKKKQNKCGNDKPGEWWVDRQGVEGKQGSRFLVTLSG